MERGPDDAEDIRMSRQCVQFLLAFGVPMFVLLS